MYRGKITRTLFEVPGNQTQPTEDKKWLRVRTGEVGSNNEYQCTASVKMRRGRSDHSHITLLKMEDYYDAVSFFVDMGLKLVSTQQNLRTKYKCNCDGDDYIICIDEWPHIEDIVVITIRQGHTGSEKEFESFLKQVQKGMSSEMEDVADIDQIYETKFGRPAMKIRHVCFNMPIEKLKSE